MLDDFFGALGPSEIPPLLEIRPQNDLSVFPEDSDRLHPHHLKEFPPRRKIPQK